MVEQKPFRIDEGLTLAFQALENSSLNCDFEQRHSSVKGVVIGGGTGAPVSIRSLLSLGIETSAVVAMADDGGSTGILREATSITPPGDIRKCIAAFASDPFNPITKAFKYRLNIANGHALGNLLLAALEDASGSFPEAIAICESLVNAQGRVYPSTLNRVYLEAVTKDGQLIEGQALACHSQTALHSVRLCSECESITAYEPALKAISEADFIVFGPGSLFTSIIPNILVPGVVEAVASSKATTLFVCSVADVQGETWGLSAKEHVQALLEHGLDGYLDYVLVNAKSPEIDIHDDNAQSGVRHIYVDAAEIEAIQSMGPMVVERELVDSEHPTWHSPSAFRSALAHILKLAEARSELS